MLEKNNIAKPKPTKQLLKQKLFDKISRFKNICSE